MHHIKSEICEGRDVSKMSMSLENLASILPTGVTSKKFNGAFNTWSNNSSWSNLAARQHARYGIKSAKIDPNAATTSIDTILVPNRTPRQGARHSVTILIIMNTLFTIANSQILTTRFQGFMALGWWISTVQIGKY